MSDDIYREVEDDLRQQKLKAFWQENGAWIIGGVFGAIVLTGGLSFWRTHEAAGNKAETAGLIATVAADDPAKLDAFAATADKNHALMALMAKAKLHEKRGEIEQAAAVYARIADMQHLDPLWRDLALLYSVMARLDKDDPAKLHAELSTLTGEKAPWRGSALEMEGLLLAREKKSAQASALFAKLADDPAIPASIRARATMLRDLHAVEKTIEKD